jgi:hypothetical protein
MKLQTFLVAAGPIVQQANGLFSAIGIAVGNQNARGVLPVSVLIAVVDHVVTGPATCTVEFRGGDTVLVRESRSWPVLPGVSAHICSVNMQCPVFEPGDYSFVAVLDTQRFVYPFPVQGEKIANVVGGVN